MICPYCHVVIKNLGRHLRRNRCEHQGAAGKKAGIPHGTKDRRNGGVAKGV